MYICANKLIKPGCRVLAVPTPRGAGGALCPSRSKSEYLGKRPQKPRASEPPTRKAWAMAKGALFCIARLVASLFGFRANSTRRACGNLADASPCRPD